MSAQATEEPGIPGEVPETSEAEALKSRKASEMVTLFAVLLGFLVVPMAMSGTSVALPEIASELKAGSGALQWVVTGYFLAASCLTLIAGSLGDIFGRRRVFGIGAVIYIGSSFCSGIVTDIILLDIARVLAGVGSACVLAGGGAVLGSTFSGAARTRAFAAVGTTAGIGLAFGPTAAGWVVGAFGWREMFFAFGAAGTLVLAGTVFMKESKSDERPKVDVYGTVTFVLGFVALMFGINQAAEDGWASLVVLCFLVVGMAILIVFHRIERRTSDPVLDLDLLRNRPFVGWLLAAVAMSIGTVGVLVYLPTYLNSAGGLTASEAGTIMLAMTVPVLVIPPLTGRLVNMGMSPRMLIVSALLLMAAGNAWLVVLSPDSRLLDLLVPLVLLGCGNGMATALVDPQAMDLVEPDRVGMTSGLLNTVQSGANTLALAIFSAALVSLIQIQVDERSLAGQVAAGNFDGAKQSELVEHYTTAWHIALLVIAGICVVLAFTVSHLVRRRGRHRREEPVYGRHRRVRSSGWRMPTWH